MSISADLVVSMLALHREGRTGVATIESEGVRTFVYLREGVVVFAEEGTNGETLGRLLVRQQLLSQEHYVEIIGKMTDAFVLNEQLRFGEVAVELGYLTEDQVRKGASRPDPLEDRARLPATGGDVAVRGLGGARGRRGQFPDGARVARARGGALGGRRREDGARAGAHDGQAPLRRARSAARPGEHLRSQRVGAVLRGAGRRDAHGRASCSPRRIRTRSTPTRCSRR